MLRRRDNGTKGNFLWKIGEAMDKSIEAQLPADKSLTGVFTDRSSAEHAYDVLKGLGYSENDINVLMSDEARVRYFPAPGFHARLLGDDLKEGPGLGGIIGAGTGTALGAMLAAAASLAIPGVGVVVAGPLAAVLTGAVIGGLSGGLLGSLVGVGMSEEHSKFYEEKIKEGNILIAVNPRSDEDTRTIIREWRNAHGEIIRQ
jgi:hypothetical protein